MPVEKRIDPTFLRRLHAHHTWVHVGYRGQHAGGEPLFDRGFDLSGTDMAAYDFADVRLGDTTFAACRLAGARFCHAFLGDCSFAGADLTGANLAKAEFRASTFEGAVLRNATLLRAWFEDVDFRGADLTEGDLRRTVFVRCDLRGADLGGAHLWGALLVGCDFRDSRFTAAGLFRLGPEDSYTVGAPSPRTTGLTVGESMDAVQRLEAEALVDWFRRAGATVAPDGL